MVHVKQCATSHCYSIPMLSQETPQLVVKRRVFFTSDFERKHRNHHAVIRCVRLLNQVWLNFLLRNQHVIRGSLQWTGNVQAANTFPIWWRNTFVSLWYCFYCQKLRSGRTMHSFVLGVVFYASLRGKISLVGRPNNAIYFVPCLHTVGVETKETNLWFCIWAKINLCKWEVLTRSLTRMVFF